MNGLRDNSWRCFGASLAGFALGLQLVLSSLGLLVAAAAEPADAFGGHALCLAGGAAQPAPAGDPAPAAPRHDHAGLCCLWHHLPGVQPVASLAPQPVAYALAAAGDRHPAALTPGPRRGPANARAPPALA